MLLELALTLLASAGQDTARPETAPPAQTPKIPIETEVLGNVKAQPIGTATLDDLALPDEYLKRVSDRVIRSSFESRYRIVVPDPPASQNPPPADAKPASAVDTTKSPTSKAEGVDLPLVIGGAVFGALVVAIVIFNRRARGGAR